MNSKENFKKLVETVVHRTGKNQEQLAVEMGYGKTYISESLAPTGKLSDKFVAAFEKTYRNVLLEKPKNHTMKAEPDEFKVHPQQLIDAYIEQKRMAEQRANDLKEIILATLQGMDKKLVGIDSNLAAVLAGVYQNSVKVDAITTTSLKSLARIEGKKEDALLKESGKTQIEIAEKYVKQGMKT